MSLSAPRVLYGIHSIAPYNRSTGVPYGILKVLASSTVSLSGEQTELFGGSSPYAWAAEDANITAEMALNFKEYPDFVFELFLGKAPTSNSAESTGNVSTIANKNGTSAVNATTGIASVAATGSDEGDLKFGRYVVVVLSGGVTVDVYCLSDVDFDRGTDGDYLTDSLKIAEAITISDTGGTTALADYGLTFTGGSGTVAMTEGDTATFEVRPVNTASMTVSIGASTDVRPEFGSVVMAQKRGTGEMFEIDAVRCKAFGLPLGFNEKEFSTAEQTVKMLYDSELNKVFDIRYVKPSS